MALATSSRKMKMKLVMEKLDFLQYFDAIVTGEEVHHSKPAPDIFLLAAKKLDLSTQDCLVIEDAASGVTAAKSAGMKCIAITTTHKEEDLEHADLIIHSFKEINFEQLEQVRSQKQVRD
jgi:beta-phosphoglucomutase-like phosphatase (HAD superfamily)